MLRRRYLFSFVLALFISTLASANSSSNMKFLHPGSNASGGFYTYPYYFSVNGGTATAMMCDAFANHVSVGESWNAHVTGLLSGKGLFGKNVMAYKAAGLIFLGDDRVVRGAWIAGREVWRHP